MCVVMMGFVPLPILRREMNCRMGRALLRNPSGSRNVKVTLCLIDVRCVDGFRASTHPTVGDEL